MLHQVWDQSENEDASQGQKEQVESREKLCQEARRSIQK